MRYITAVILLLLTSCVARTPVDGISQPPMPPLAAWKPSVELADKLLANGGAAMALSISDQLLAKTPRNAAALVRRGDALVALARNEEAATSYTTAIEIEPRNSRALMGLGRLRLNQDPAAAEALFARITSRDRKDAAALNNLGIARDMQGHHTAAQEAYHMALDAAPESVAARVNLGVSMALSGNADAATRLLQPLAAAPSASLAVRHDLALALALGGQREKASAVLGHDLPSDAVGRALDGYEALRL